MQRNVLFNAFILFLIFISICYPWQFFKKLCLTLLKGCNKYFFQPRCNSTLDSHYRQWPKPWSWETSQSPLFSLSYSLNLVSYQVLPILPQQLLNCFSCYSVFSVTIPSSKSFISLLDYYNNLLLTSNLILLHISRDSVLKLQWGEGEVVVLGINLILLLIYLKLFTTYRIKSKLCGMTYQGLYDLLQPHLSQLIIPCPSCCALTLHCPVHTATYNYNAMSHYTSLSSTMTKVHVLLLALQSPWTALSFP